MLRQVIVNSHSPDFVQTLEDAQLLCAVRRMLPAREGKVAAVTFRPLPGTWREKAGTRSVSRRELKDFLQDQGKRHEQEQ